MYSTTQPSTCDLMEVFVIVTIRGCLELNLFIPYCALIGNHYQLPLLQDA
jgi:hypothetical protein